jgi:hypothetical protein
MILSQKSINTLKNFAGINQSIMVQPGNVLRTISNSNVIVAKAVVEEDFNVPFGIYDLNEFLSALNLFDTPDIEFFDKQLSIKEQLSDRSISYRYCDPTIIHTTAKEIQMPSTEVQFMLTEKDLVRLLKTSNVLGNPNICLRNGSDSDTAELLVLDVNNPASNVYSHSVKLEKSCENNFNFIFKVENIMVIPKDYMISISSKFISHFDNQNDNLQYWIALEANSTFE